VGCQCIKGRGIPRVSDEGGGASRLGFDHLCRLLRFGAIIARNGMSKPWVCIQRVPAPRGHASSSRGIRRLRVACNASEERPSLFIFGMG
jgi:hypothetical protein